MLTTQYLKEPNIDEDTFYSFSPANPFSHQSPEELERPRRPTQPDEGRAPPRRQPCWEDVMRGLLTTPYSSSLHMSL